MSELQIFIAAPLVSVALLNSIANRLRVPVPIVPVVGGVAALASYERGARPWNQPI